MSYDVYWPKHQDVNILQKSVMRFGQQQHADKLPCAPALSEMMVGMERSARAKAAIARLRLPGVRAAASSTTCRQNAHCRRGA